MPEQYVQRFRKIQDHSRVPRWRKRCMLLAVIELAERGALAGNEIRYGSPLLDTYRRYFAAVEGHDEGAEAHDPFFYLKNEGFWRLEPRPGRAQHLREMRRPMTPTWGRALRAGLIAPSPDMTWCVSPIFQRRIAENAPLLDLAGRDVIFTGDPRHRPARQALEWSVARLRTANVTATDPSRS